MPRVTFLPADRSEGQSVEAAEGESLFGIAGRAGIPVPTACNGQATCGLCRVKIVRGGEGLTPLNAQETKHLGNVYFITRQRLSCQARLLAGADVVVQLAGMPVAKRSLAR